MTSKDQEKDNKSVLSISPEEFEFETRYVVLNFLGLVPAGGNLSASRGSSDGRRSSHLREAPGNEPRKVAENGSGSDEWGSLHELPQMSLTDKIKHHGPHRHGHIPLEQYKPASLGDIRTYELKGADETENEFDGYTYDDDDTVYRAAAFKKKKPPASSDEEISIPVVKSLDYDEGDSYKHEVEDRRLGSGTKYLTQDIDDQYKVYNYTEERGSRVQGGGTIQDQILQSGGEFNHKASDPHDLVVQQGGEDIGPSKRSDIPKPPTSRGTSNLSKRNDIPRPAVAKDETPSKRGDIPRPPFGDESGSVPKDGEVALRAGSRLVKGEEDPRDEEEEGSDGVDCAMPFRDQKNFEAERPNSLDNLVKQGPTPFRYKKSRSPVKYKGSFMRTPTFEGEKSDINREKSPLKRADSQRSPKPDYKSQVSGSSRLSDLSDMESLMTSIRSQSSRTSYVEITHMSQYDVDTLVKNSGLPNKLREEIEEELEELDVEYKSKGQLPVTPPILSRSLSMSPESKVAQYLSCIGDRVQEKYGENVTRAFDRVFNLPTDNISYDDVKSAAGEMTQNTSGWTKVTLLLLLGKKLTWGLLSKDPSENVVHNMTTYTTKLLEDQVADFIINKGGWNSISELEELGSQGSSPDILPENDLADVHPLHCGFQTISDKDTGRTDTTDTGVVDNNTRDEVSPDLSSMSTAMMTSVHSEASTLVDGTDKYNTGMSRDTSSETLPSSLFSPTDSSTNKSGPSAGSSHDLLDTGVNNNQDDNIVTKSVSMDGLSRVPLCSPDPHKPTTPSVYILGDGDGISSLLPSTEEGGEEEMFEGACAAPPTPTEEFDYDDVRHRQVEGTMDLNIIKQELYLLRQLSNQYEQDSETERNKQFGIKLGLGLLGAAIVLAGAFVILRHMKPSTNKS